MDDQFNSEFFFNKIFETRNFEISLFWKRSNYFLFLNVSIAAGLFSIPQDSYLLLIFLSIFGGFSSFLWYRVNLGSKYWQSKWEEELADFERTVTKGRSIGSEGKELKFFAIEKKEADQLVKNSLNRNSKSYTGLREKINERILKKPSVSYQMILLSALFILFWIAILIYYSIKFYFNSCIL